MIGLAIMMGLLFGIPGVVCLLGAWVEWLWPSRPSSRKYIE